MRGDGLGCDYEHLVEKELYLELEWCSGDGEKWLGFRHIQDGELQRFGDGLDWVATGERGDRDGSLISL